MKQADKKRIQELIKEAREREIRMYKEIGHSIRTKTSFGGIIEDALQGFESEIEEDIYTWVLEKEGG